MKLISILLIISIFTGCTTFKPLESEPGLLQEKIISEEVVKPGKIINIVTSDGKHHEFKVVNVTDHYIEGKNVQVAIEDIESVETKEHSGTKTVLMLVGCFILTSGLIFLIAHQSEGK